MTEEALRLATPGQIIPRVTRAPVRLHGIDLGEGVPVFLALGSANLDPAAHPEADRFKPGRSGETLLMFGRGRHRCIGAQLGVLQISSMLGALRTAGAVPMPRRWSVRPGSGHRWPVAMQVALPRQ
ncbi:MAG: cytochrome P450 [Thalassovita sp.]